MSTTLHAAIGAVLLVLLAACEPNLAMPPPPPPTPITGTTPSGNTSNVLVPVLAPGAPASAPR